MRRWRRRALVAIALFAVATLVACGGDTRDATRRSGSSGSTATTSAADAYVGLTTRAAIAKADAAGVRWRITREDNEQFMVTQDYDPARLNFEVDDGRVTTATYG